MAGSEKLFVHLEPLVMQNIDKFSTRDLSHIMYAYSVRSSGNPELHSLFESQLLSHIQNPSNLDYGTMFNLVYYMMFR